MIETIRTETLDCTLARMARLRPLQEALVDGATRFCYSELEQRVGRLAAGLRARGLRPGGIVAAFPKRSFELPLLFLATARAGGIFAPLDARTEPSRIELVLKRRPDILYVAPDQPQLAEKMIALMQDERRVLHGLEEEEEEEHLPPSTDINSVCYYNFTSGSTGVPKAAPTTHAQIQANTAAVLSAFPFTEKERFLCLFAPWSHPHEHWVRSLAVGATTVMADGLRPRTLVNVLRQERITWLFAIPSVFELLMAQVQETGPLPDLRMCESGGAVVTPDLVRRVEAVFGCQMAPIWGCTETTGVVLHVPPWDPDRRLDTLGRPLPGYELRIDSPDPQTGVGELCVRGPSVVAGYLERPEETAARFSGGWYHTGDLVRLEDGCYRFLGRREEMIKVGGVKVYLLEVERLIQELPNVRQVVVVPATDPLRGEIPRAVVVPRGKLTRGEVLAWCRARLPAAMVPRLVEIWDELPAFPSGKLDKRAVMERRSLPLWMAVNSMIIGARPLSEVFRLATTFRERGGVEVIVDLRSRRDPASDPDGLWSVAHHNADFDIGDPASVQRAVAMAKEAGLLVGMSSAYVGACEPGDLDYGLRAIEGAYALAEVAPQGTLILRVLGGDIRARGRSMPGRWQDVRKQLRDDCLQTLRRWEAHTRELAAQTGRKVILGLEIHHGQYLGELHEVHHCCQGLKETGWEFLGFIEDPANRFIAAKGDLLSAMDFARMVRAWGGRLIAWHLKDVRYISPWPQYHPQPIQKIGERFFVWDTDKYAWAELGEGEVDLSATLSAAALLSEPPGAGCIVSTEYVASSESEAEAAAVLSTYHSLLRDGSV